MKNENSKQNSKLPRDPYGIQDDTGIACSAQDCTGLIPALPETEDQIEMYEELFPYLAKAGESRDASDNSFLQFSDSSKEQRDKEITCSKTTTEHRQIN